MSMVSHSNTTSIALIGSSIANGGPNLPPLSSAHSLCPYSPTSQSHKCPRVLKKQDQSSCADNRVLVILHPSLTGIMLEQSLVWKNAHIRGCLLHFRGKNGTAMSFLANEFSAIQKSADDWQFSEIENTGRCSAHL